MLYKSILIKYLTFERCSDSLEVNECSFVNYRLVIFVLANVNYRGEVALHR